MSNSVAEKIRKLLAHAESASTIGNVAEAEAFAARVTELLIKHKLSMDEVSGEQAQRITVGEDRIPGREHWMRLLAQAISNAHGCEFLIAADRLVFIGRDGDREVTVYLFSKLRVAAKALWKRYAAGHRYGTRRRASFLRGFVVGINERLRPIAALHNNCQALERSRAEAKGYCDTRYVTQQVNHQLDRPIWEGYYDGYVAAQGADLRADGLSGTKSGQLPAGDQG